MPDMIDRAYYERRAKEQIEMAEKSTDACAKRTHLILAAEYREKANGSGAKAA
ncbi:hypothetical protein [Sphingobium phenoxybenzoativorans]|uniref:hypothetical protein n=1 Tax=Sphingobium phenoxybenzoativorans TaxID=1592790 RepID=UPI001495C3F1|nr:hypothetical protein [Sphingobium phenoxybenzoativorans]